MCKSHVFKPPFCFAQLLNLAEIEFMFGYFSKGDKKLCL